MIHVRDYLGSGALLAVLGDSVPALGQLPNDVRHAFWGAVGAALAYAVGTVLRAAGDRAAAKIRGRVRRPATTDAG